MKLFWRWQHQRQSERFTFTTAALLLLADAILATLWTRRAATAATGAKTFSRVPAEWASASSQPDKQKPVRHCQCTVVSPEGCRCAVSRSVSGMCDTDCSHQVMRTLPAAATIVTTTMVTEVHHHHHQHNHLHQQHSSRTQVLFLQQWTWLSWGQSTLTLKQISYLIICILLPYHSLLKKIYRYCQSGFRLRLSVWRFVFE